MELSLTSWKQFNVYFEHLKPALDVAFCVWEHVFFRFWFSFKLLWRGSCTLVAFLMRCASFSAARHSVLDAGMCPGCGVISCCAFPPPASEQWIAPATALSRPSGEANCVFDWSNQITLFIDSMVFWVLPCLHLYKKFSCRKALIYRQECCLNMHRKLQLVCSLPRGCRRIGLPPRVHPN